MRRATLIIRNEGPAVDQCVGKFYKMREMNHSNIKFLCLAYLFYVICHKKRNFSLSLSLSFPLFLNIISRKITLHLVSRDLKLENSVSAAPRTHDPRACVRARVWARVAYVFVGGTDRTLVRGLSRCSEGRKGSENRERERGGRGTSKRDWPCKPANNKVSSLLLPHLAASPDPRAPPHRAPRHRVPCCLSPNLFRSAQDQRSGEPRERTHGKKDLSGALGPRDKIEIFLLPRGWSLHPRSWTSEGTRGDWSEDMRSVNIARD